MGEPAQSELGGSYWVAAFAVDGKLLGVGEMFFAKLSSHWLNVCSGLISHYGPVFDVDLQGPLSHIRLKCTSSEGAALLNLYVHDRPASSVAIASGLSPAAEKQVLTMFAESVRESAQAFHAGDATTPFIDILTRAERPLLIVIPWPNETISEEDRDLVKELIWHFAGAFLKFDTLH